MGKLKKGIFVVFIANIINLSVSIIRNFILPKYLSVETYADIKMYQLYISYAGLAALGYIDGMYLKYGGKSIDSIDGSDLKLNRSTFRIFEFCISLTLLIIGLIRKDIIFVAMSASFFAMNMADYYRCFFQATGEFSIYSRIMNLSSLLTLIITLVLLFVVRTDNSIIYIFGSVFVYYFVWILLEIRNTNKDNGLRCLFSFSELKFSVTTGIALMLGTLLSTFMTGLDRWFVKFTLSTYDFAMYSFAASTVGFLSYAISPISITLYNYFCSEKNEKNINKIRDIIIIFLSGIICLVFPIKFVIEYYLPKYSAAVNVIVILFASQLVYGLTRCFYVNLYKAEKRQVEYFKGIVFVTIMGVLFNAGFFFIYKHSEAYAIGTFFAGVVWLLLCNVHFKKYKLSLINYFYSIIICSSFVLCGLLFRSFIGFIVYFIIFIGVSYLMMKDSFVELILMGKNQLFDILHKIRKE